MPFLPSNGTSPHVTSSTVEVRLLAEIPTGAAVGATINILQDLKIFDYRRLCSIL